MQATASEEAAAALRVEVGGLRMGEHASAAEVELGREAAESARREAREARQQLDACAARRAQAEALLEETAVWLRRVHGDAVG
jgi:hypothetical protein